MEDGLIVKNVAKAGDEEGEIEIPVTPVKRIDVTKEITQINSTAYQAGVKAKVGDVITYSIKVKNTGNTTVSAITIEDPMFGDSWTKTIGELGAGQSETFTGSYTVKEEDAAAGSVQNRVSAENEDGTKDDDEVTVPVENLKLTYNANGGTGNPPAMTGGHYAGQTVTLAGNSGTPELSRTGYTFDGWSLTQDGVKTATVTFANADITVYAKWDSVGGGGKTADVKTPNRKILDPPKTTTPPDEVLIGDDYVPFKDFPKDIPIEDVPIGDIPQTGMAGYAFYMFLMFASALALGLFTWQPKKRREEYETE
jgi:uncharacterized repeat protein (TIGR02543 family)